MNTITGRSAFLSLLKSEGVSHMFGNPGTTELPIMHALTAEPDMTYILGLQEAIVVAMADGYARASGNLVACNVHVAPGLGNALGSLYTAKRSGTPMILTAGQQEQGHGLMEPLLYDPLVPMAEPLVKWAVEVTRLEDLPRIVHRAAKIATTPPTGPVFISLPGDILNAEADLALGDVTRVATDSRPGDETLTQLVAAVLSAEKPAIVAGHEIATSHAFAEAAQFAELIGAPVYQQTVTHGAHFPSEHPTYMGSLSRDQGFVHDTLSPYDMLICLGADVLQMSVHSETDPLPARMRVIQITERDWELGKNYATEIAVRGQVKATLSALNAKLRRERNRAQTDRAVERVAALADRNWRAKRATTAEALAAHAGDQPINSDWLIQQLVDNLPERVAVVDEGITSTRSLLKLYPFRHADSFYGNVSGGIGWAIAAAVGVSLADRSRPVVATIGDGSSMYSIQALWSAAHMKLPITYVIPNNGGYRILKQRLKAFHGNEQYIAMDFEDPPIDFTAISKGLGVPAEKIEKPVDFVPAFQAALAHDGPNLLEVVVDGRV